MLRKADSVLSRAGMGVSCVKKERNVRGENNTNFTGRKGKNPCWQEKGGRETEKKALRCLSCSLSWKGERRPLIWGEGGR